MTKVTVIVPVYNVEKYLHRCIDSILNQNFKDFELILVNDGSTDKSGEICDDYQLKDNRIKVIHKENGGLSSARNAGLDIAEGDYIGFIDSDDFIHLNMLYSMYYAGKEYEADIVSCKFMCFDEFTNIDEIRQSEELYDKKIKIYNSYQALSEYVSYKNESLKDIHTAVTNKLYKRQLFNNIRFPLGKIYEDGYVTYLLLHAANKVVTLESTYYYYLIRSNSIMRTAAPIKILETYDDWCLIYRFLYNNYRDLSCFAATRYLNKCFKLYAELDRYDIDEKDKDFFKLKIQNVLNTDYHKLMKLKIGKKNKIILFLFRYVQYKDFFRYYKLINNI